MELARSYSNHPFLCALGIAGNFRGRKLSQFGGSKIFKEKTFVDCLLVSQPKILRPSISGRKLSQIATKIHESFLPQIFPTMYMYLGVILEDASSEEVEEVGRGDDGLSGWYLHPFTQDQHVAESEERTGTILVLVEGVERGGRGERGGKRGEGGGERGGRKE